MAITKTTQNRLFKDLFKTKDVEYSPAEITRILKGLITEFNEAPVPASNIITHKATLTSATLQTMHNTNFVLLPGVTDGYHKILGIDYIYRFNTVGYNADIGISIKRGFTFPITAAVIPNIGQAESIQRKVQIELVDANLGGFSAIVGHPLTVETDFALGAGDGEVDVYITYEEITL